MLLYWSVSFLDTATILSQLFWLGWVMDHGTQCNNLMITFPSVRLITSRYMIIPGQWMICLWYLIPWWGLYFNILPMCIMFVISGIDSSQNGNFVFHFRFRKPLICRSVLNAEFLGKTIELISCNSVVMFCSAYRWYGVIQGAGQKVKEAPG